MRIHARELWRCIQVQVSVKDLDLGSRSIITSYALRSQLSSNRLWDFAVYLANGLACLSFLESLIYNIMWLELQSRMCGVEVLIGLEDMENLMRRATAKDC
jgi:hypothetical protein